MLVLYIYPRIKGTQLMNDGPPQLPRRPGHHRVRIHAVGFPVMFSVPGVSNTTGVRLATLMRLLCRKNGGTFVGLSRLEMIGILPKPFPEPSRQMIRYWGWYANAARGKRRKRRAPFGGSDSPT